MTDVIDDSGFLRAFIDAVPALLFVVDEDVAILECNGAAARLLDVEKVDALRRRAGDVLHCLHSTDSEEGCGRGTFCRNCVIRDSVTRAFAGEEAVRRRTKMELVTENGVLEIYALITASTFTYAGRRLGLLVIEDISQLVELQKIVPICGQCKKVRNDDQYWTGVEAFFKKEWDVDFSHGYCPECARVELAKMHRLTAR